jgi:hypothetical protein
MLRATLKVTSNHPFYVDSGLDLVVPSWVEAGQLQAGDRLRTEDGRDVAVLAVHWNVGEAHVYTLTVASDHDFFVGPARVLVHNCDITPSGRDALLGRTPSKASRTGREVIQRMTAEGKIRTSDGRTEVLFEGNWYLIEQTDMGHTVDAVRWWNSTGKYFGPKDPRVRAFMLDPDNYELQPSSINRSRGAIMGNSGQTYEPPVTQGD